MTYFRTAMIALGSIFVARADGRVRFCVVGTTGDSFTLSCLGRK